jgi:hypothetical protein
MVVMRPRAPSTASGTFCVSLYSRSPVSLDTVEAETRPDEVAVDDVPAAHDPARWNGREQESPFIGRDHPV